jgi:hypothetical protein
MFHSTAPVAEPAPDVDVVMDPADVPVPLSHLALDLPEPPGGWVAYLAGRGVEVTLDDIGRLSVPRDAARMLLTEHREAEAAHARKRAELDRQAVEADQLRRAQIWRGVPADRLPADVHPASVMLQAVVDSRPRRRSMLEESLAGDSLTFHPIGPDGNES